MRTTTALLAGAVLAWCWLAIWRGPSRWFFYRIPPKTHPDCHPRIRIWIARVEQDGAAWPE